MANKFSPGCNCCGSTCGNIGTDISYPGTWGSAWYDLHNWIGPHVGTWKHNLISSSNFSADIADLKVIIGGWYPGTGGISVRWNSSTQWLPLKNWVEAGGRLCIMTTQSLPPPNNDAVTDSANLAAFLSYLGCGLARNQSNFDGGVCPLRPGTPKCQPQWAPDPGVPPTANLAKGLLVHCRGSSHVYWAGGSNPWAVVLRSTTGSGFSCVVEKIGNGFVFLFGETYFVHNLGGVYPNGCYDPGDNPEFWRRLLCYSDSDII